MDKYLSELKAITPFLPTRLNLIYSPCSSGKSRFASVKLYQDLHQQLNEKSYLILTPLKIVARQLGLNNGVDVFSSSDLQALGFINFDEKHEITQKTIGTFQAFIAAFRKNENILDHIGAIVIDEVDMCFIDLVQWERGGRLSNDIYRFLAKCIEKRIFLIGMSGTGMDKIQRQFAAFYPQIIKFDGVPRQVKNYYSQNPFFIHYKNEVIRLAYENKKFVLYSPRVKELTWAKEYLEKLNKKVALLVSDNAINYTMTEYDKDVMNTIEEFGVAPSDCDVLLYNNSAYRGLNILGKQFSTLVVNSSDIVAQTQAEARFRSGGIQVFYRMDIMSPKYKEWQQNPKNFTLPNADYKQMIRNYCESYGDKKKSQERKQWLLELGLVEGNGKAVAIKKMEGFIEEVGWEFVKKRSGNDTYYHLRKQNGESNENENKSKKQYKVEVVNVTSTKTKETKASNTQSTYKIPNLAPRRVKDSNTTPKSAAIPTSVKTKETKASNTQSTYKIPNLVPRTVKKSNTNPQSAAIPTSAKPTKKIEEKVLNKPSTYKIPNLTPRKVKVS